MAEDKRLICPIRDAAAWAGGGDVFCLGDKCALWHGNKKGGSCAFLSIARLTGVSYAE